MEYGKELLELALPKAKALGIRRILVTCDETNIGSRKISEANGWVFENALEIGKGKPRKLQYWITV
jgi:predicted acetyltransferase